MSVNEYKVQMSEIKLVGGEEGMVEAYVNTMGVMDHDRDIIDPNAFNSSIKNNLPIPVLQGHDQSAIIGKVLYARAEELESPEHRLLARIQMNLDTQAGRDAFSNIAGNFVRQWSVGFNIPSTDSVVYEKDKSGQPIRRILNLDWKELSSVISGASPSTMTIAAKSDDDEILPGELDPAISEATIDDVIDDAPATEEDSAAATLQLQIAIAQARLTNDQKRIA